jgi:citrate lyase beta subunit
VTTRAHPCPPAGRTLDQELCLTYNPVTTSPSLSSLRSLLFAPGNDERKLHRAATGPADGLIADLEDAVPPHARAEARATIAEVLADAQPGTARLVRINGAGTSDFDEDRALVGALRPDAIVLPKATPEAVDLVADLDLPVLAIVESAQGVREAFEIAARPQVFALLIGGVDLGAALGLEPREDGLELHYVRSKCVIDSAAAGIRPPFDVVHVALDDREGLERQALLARSLGLRGKACIHPAQVDVVNAVFTPAHAMVEWARDVLEAAESAAAGGSGALAVNGEMVDEAVVARARRVIDESERSGGG